MDSTSTRIGVGFRLRGLACAAVAVVWLAGLEGCQQPADLAPFRPAELQRVQAEAVPPTVPQVMAPLPQELQVTFPTPTTERAPTTWPAIPPTTQPFEEPQRALTLQQVIHSTAANNVEARVAGYDPAINQARVQEAIARFDPTWFTQYQHQRTYNNSNLSFNPLNPTKVTTDVLQTGLRQNLSSGGQVELRYQAARTELDPAGFGTNPYYVNEVSLQLTQPLLRDFGNEVNRARILIARNDERISVLDFRLRMEESIAKVEEAYWRLAQAVQDVRILEDLLFQTIETGKHIRQRWGQDVTKVELSQANATIEARRAALVQARARVRDLSDQIKQLMADPNLPVGNPALVVPADAPYQDALRIDLSDQISAALMSRPELAQQQARIDSASVIVRAARNNLLPQLNAIGSIGLQGNGGDWSDATRQQGNTDLINYTLGLALEVPLGNRAARAIYVRTVLQRQQAIDQYRNLVDLITQQVRTSHRAVMTAWQEMVAAQRAVLAAEDALDAIDRQWGKVALSPSFVQLRLDRQASLAETRRSLLNAKVTYNVAISALERTKGTLLRYNNIVLREESLPTVNMK